VSVDAAFVARQLDASRRQHLLYRQYVPRMASVAGQPTPLPELGDSTQALSTLTLARDLRIAAHEADPDHEAPAWGEEIISHADMMAYYTHVLGVDG
jgi:hypothetical protein